MLHSSIRLGAAEIEKDQRQGGRHRCQQRIHPSRKSPPVHRDGEKLLTADGRFIIEVEYIGNILRHIQFERFYLDRIFYYSLTSLKHLFESHGMAITDVEEIEPHGGSLQVTCSESGGFAPSGQGGRAAQARNRTLTVEKLEEFRKKCRNADRCISRNARETIRRSGLKVAGYGAPARVSTICNYGNIGPSLIEYTVDDSPLKQNRFTPGTHIPIVTRAHLESHRPDILAVFAYEYLDDIRKKTGGLIAICCRFRPGK